MTIHDNCFNCSPSFENMCAYDGIHTTSFPGYSYEEEYPGTGSRFLGRILKLF